MKRYCRKTICLVLGMVILAKKKSITARLAGASDFYLVLLEHFIRRSFGMVGGLHLWERNMGYHLHVHYLVPIRSIDPNTRKWNPAQLLIGTPYPFTTLALRPSLSVRCSYLLSNVQIHCLHN